LTMNYLPKLRRNENGSVAVEFALFLPLLLVIVFGIIELGSAWYFKQVLVSASRDGARYASLYSESGTTDQEVASYIQGNLTASGFPGSASVQVTGAQGAPGAQVSVDITSNYDLPVLGALVPGVEASLTLRSTTVMRHE
jgi:Flp pilus assembly protein TadG